MPALSSLSRFLLIVCLGFGCSCPSSGCALGIGPSIVSVTGSVGAATAIVDGAAVSPSGDAASRIDGVAMGIDGAAKAIVDGASRRVGVGKASGDAATAIDGAAISNAIVGSTPAIAIVLSAAAIGCGDFSIAIDWCVRVVAIPLVRRRTPSRPASRRGTAS